MKLFYLLLLSGFISKSLAGQDAPAEFDGHSWVAPYHLPAPTGWGIERFPIPIMFAPDIKYKGIEDIRFTPGWGNAESEEYWSYAFLWWLDGNITASSAMIDSNLRFYYTGLVKINSPDLAPEKLTPVVSSFRETQTAPGDLRTFSGTIQLTDYMKEKPLLLYGKVHWRVCPGEEKTFIFYELSPQPYSHKVWMGLGQLWSGFRCSIK